MSSTLVEYFNRYLRKGLKSVECGGYVFIMHALDVLLTSFSTGQHVSCTYHQRLKLQHSAHVKDSFRDARRMSKFIGTAYQQTFSHTGTSRMAFNRRFKPTGLTSQGNMICTRISHSTRKCYLPSGMMPNNSTPS
jgi:hypothetical protein